MESTACFSRVKTPERSVKHPARGTQLPNPIDLRAITKRSFAESFVCIDKWPQSARVSDSHKSYDSKPLFLTELESYLDRSLAHLDEVRRKREVSKWKSQAKKSDAPVPLAPTEKKSSLSVVKFKFADPSAAAAAAATDEATSPTNDPRDELDGGSSSEITTTTNTTPPPLSQQDSDPIVLNSDRTPPSDSADPSSKLGPAHTQHAKTDDYHHDQELAVFRHCFQMLIDKFSIYGPLLRRIQQRYELAVSSLQRDNDRMRKTIDDGMFSIGSLDADSKTLIGELKRKITDRSHFIHELRKEIHNKDEASVQDRVTISKQSEKIVHLQEELDKMKEKYHREQVELMLTNRSLVENVRRLEHYKQTAEAALKSSGKYSSFKQVDLQTRKIFQDALDHASKFEMPSEETKQSMERNVRLEQELDRERKQSQQFAAEIQALRNHLHSMAKPIMVDKGCNTSIRLLDDRIGVASIGTHNTAAVLSRGDRAGSVTASSQNGSGTTALPPIGRMQQHRIMNASSYAPNTGIRNSAGPHSSYSFSSVSSGSDSTPFSPGSLGSSPALTAISSTSAASTATTTTGTTTTTVGSIRSILRANAAASASSANSSNATETMPRLRPGRVTIDVVMECDRQVPVLDIGPALVVRQPGGVQSARPDLGGGSLISAAGTGGGGGGGGGGGASTRHPIKPGGMSLSDLIVSSENEPGSPMRPWHQVTGHAVGR